MDIKALAGLLQKNKVGTLEADEFSEMMNTLLEGVERSKKAILESVSEEDFVGMCRTVKFVVLSTCLANGRGQAALLASEIGELDGILDTYFLAVLGLLIQDEIV